MDKKKIVLTQKLYVKWLKISRTAVELSVN
jgi:hypothetical protein